MRIRDTRQWADRALCIDLDPDYFTAPPAVTNAWTSGNRRRWAEVMNRGQVCEQCPVMRECAADAFACKDSEVIRGGITLGGRSGAAHRAWLVTRAGLQMVAAGLPLDQAVDTLMQAYDREHAGAGRNIGGGVR
jgi:hypothetical protein